MTITPTKMSDSIISTVSEAGPIVATILVFFLHPPIIQKSSSCQQINHVTVLLCRFTLDEPFSALDTFTAKTLREDLLKIWQERKMTIVMVTHNIEEALQLADRIGVMSSRPGTIVKIVENTLPRPRSVRSQAFFDKVDELTLLVKV